MGVAHLIRHALAMPPREAARKVWRHSLRVVSNNLVGRLMRRQCSYPPSTQVIGRLARRLVAVEPGVLRVNAPALRALAADVCAHRFDLLGSGSVCVAYGERFAGFAAHRYGPGPKPAKDEDWRDWLAGRHWPGNRERARKLLGLIADAAYVPIDWQVDFVSGYRWSERTFGGSIAYGHHAGVDVKVPWELARLQHLPGLALAYGLDGDRRLAAEFRHQILDFLGANPPGWGVNWACAMDVAIRAVNILMARDLFLAHGAQFDEPFEEELAAAMLAHMRHITGHLEWNAHHRGNHYLADVCGLVWIAAYLPSSEETDIVLALGIQEFAAEVERQFTADGANFEASTAYHRLSTEMVLYTAALVMGLPAERRRALVGYDHRRWRRQPPLAPSPLPWPPLSDEACRRLAGAVRFAADVTKPSGEMVQIGDNDSGRFLLLTPGMPPLDPRHLVAAAEGLFELGLAGPAEAAVERVAVAQLAGGVRLGTGPGGTVPLPAAAPAQNVARKVERFTVRCKALTGMSAIAYPDFGLFIWRNARAFVSVRCGPVGQNGNGGHAHNDQLAVEIEIDGVPWARDPGTFVYTADVAWRNAYRSVRAHFAPRRGVEEPARMVAPFRLEDRARARALCFSEREFLGRHDGYAEPVWRHMSIGDGELVIEDRWGGALVGAGTEMNEWYADTRADMARLLADVPDFSPGYGRTEPAVGR